MAFADQKVIMFTQALLDNPTDAWEVEYTGEGDDRKPSAVVHTPTKHKWALSDSSVNQTGETVYQGSRVV